MLCENFCKADISPSGTITMGTEIVFKLTLKRPDIEPTLIIYKAEAKDLPQILLPMKNESQNGDENTYFAVYSPTECGLYFYRFITNSGKTIGRAENLQAEYNLENMWQFTVYEPSYVTPKSFHGQVFYQIFPDRFFSSGSPKLNVPSDRIMHLNWHEEPVSMPNAEGKFLCNDYFGGDLKGIEQKLEYLLELGVYGIYLNPIFEAHSNHRYNTADYMKIDSLLGTSEDFSNLCKKAHSLGMAVVLDGVFNHTGSDSIYFNKECRYGESGAFNDEASPYRNWYNISAKGEYDSWWGFETLPNVNESSASYREFICGKDGVLRHWLRLGADGFRLDVADELPDDFIEEIRTCIKKEKPNAILLGEVWEDASNKFAYGKLRRYFWGKELDSVMNYPWRSAILDFIRNGNGTGLLNAISVIIRHYPQQSLLCSLNSLSTHDVPRAITELVAQPVFGRDRSWQGANNKISDEDYAVGRQLFMLASIIQFTLPGCPCIYYGDEAGLYGYADPFNRGTYPWGKEDSGLVEFFKLLGGLRKNSEILRLGNFLPVWFDEKTCVYIREYFSKKCLVAVNRSTDTLKIMYDGSALKKAKILLYVGSIFDKITLGGHSAVVLEL